MSITCIIPAYNEASNLPYVLSQLSKIPLITQIIVINDGSTDNTIETVASFPSITLLNHPTNMGKSASIKTGLNLAIYPHILLCDADLTTLNIADFTHAIKLFEDLSLDLLILRRANEPILNQLFKANLMLSGIRLISRQSLKSILNQNPTSYQIELYINHYMQKHNKNIGQTRVRYYDLHKTAKLGVIPGLIQEFIMYSSLLRLPIYWTQLFTFNPPTVSLVKYSCYSRGRSRTGGWAGR